MTNKGSAKFLNLLLLGDLAFICGHCFYTTGIISNPLLSIEEDLAFPEMYQYIKEFWIVVLLLMLTISRRRLIYFSWALLFMYLLLDDSLLIHEKLGQTLVEYFELKPMFRLRPQDYGELIVLAFFGFFLFAFIGLAYLFSHKHEKKISKHLFMLVFLLVVFGVFVDMVHVAIQWGYSIWGLIEDGGEMIIMSIIVWYIFDLKNGEVNPQTIEGNG